MQNFRNAKAHWKRILRNENSKHLLLVVGFFPLNCCHANSDGLVAMVTEKAASSLTRDLRERKCVCWERGGEIIFWVYERIFSLLDSVEYK